MNRAATGTTTVLSLIFAGIFLFTSLPFTATDDLSRAQLAKRAFRVIKKFGLRGKSALTFAQYEARLSRSGTNQAWSPDWFYDTHIISFYRDDVWISVSLNTSGASRESDPRIKRLLKDSPELSVDVKLNEAGGTTYLIDSNGNGTLDFAYKQGELKAGSGANSGFLKIRQAEYDSILKRILSVTSAGEMFQ